MTQEYLSFRPTTPRGHPSPGSLNTVHCLAYEEYDESTLNPWMVDHSSEDDILAHCLPSIAEEDKDDRKEYFPMLLLDDDFWMEEPFPERHLCIHKNSQHDLYPYPCPYNLNLLCLSQEDALC